MFSSKETIEKRGAICSACEHKKVGTCMQCGCIIASKIRFSSSQCPLGLWQVEIRNENQSEENK